MIQYKTNFSLVFTYTLLADTALSGGIVISASSMMDFVTCMIVCVSVKWLLEGKTLWIQSDTTWYLLLVLLKHFHISNSILAPLKIS